MKSKKFLITELKKVFKKELNINVNDDSKIYDDEKWDSIGNFNLLLSIEKKFQINFNPQEFNKLNSFNEILKIVAKKSK
ncbi:acyl carrier protein [Pelagibacteraceae bacterium]|jgi:acyl carrier protein|nr:acyl carrier protein [Pelagibacteraceae bacterium]|tara:strand:- start:444 stop:680 length:237 start_codon:yes stop_codon:yes gene_type:complete